MRRVIPLIVVGILLAGVLWDPYSTAYDGSDYIRPAPLWQTSFAILDISLLLGLVAVSVRMKFRGAAILAVSEAAYYLAGNAVLYLRDGAARFVHGYGAESNLGEHVVVIVLRILLIVYLAVLSSRPMTRHFGQRAA